MSTQSVTPEFKEEAVKSVVDCGYGAPDVAARLGVSAHSLYKWGKAVSPASPPVAGAGALLRPQELTLRIVTSHKYDINPPFVKCETLSGTLGAISARHLHKIARTN